MTKYAYELRKQIAIEAIREEFVSLLLRAASDGYGMDNKEELEELAEFLSEEVARRGE